MEIKKITSATKGLRQDIVDKFVCAIEAAPVWKKKRLKKALDHQVSYAASAMYRALPTDSLEAFLLGATKEDILAVVADKENNLRDRSETEIGVPALSPQQYDYLRCFIDAVNFITDSRKDLHVDYEETALYEKHEVWCTECGCAMLFECHGTHNSYVCPMECTKVSCHPHTAMPEGIPATAKLRKMRQELHFVTDCVFKGDRKHLYRFLSEMLGRSFNTFEGHIGSMDESECEKMLELFNFLKHRATHLQNMRSLSKGDYLLEEYFLSHANHTEIQAYYFLVRSGFAFDAIGSMFDLSESQEHRLLAAMVSKGLPLTKNLDKIHLFEELLPAIVARQELSDRLLHADASDYKKFVFF